MKMISDLGQEFGEYMIQLTSELFLRKEQPHSLSEMEERLRKMLFSASWARRWSGSTSSSDRQVVAALSASLIFSV